MSAPSSFLSAHAEIGRIAIEITREIQETTSTLANWSLLLAESARQGLTRPADALVVQQKCERLDAQIHALLEWLSDETTPARYAPLARLGTIVDEVRRFESPLDIRINATVSERITAPGPEAFFDWIVSLLLRTALRNGMSEAQVILRDNRLHGAPGFLLAVSDDGDTPTPQSSPLVSWLAAQLGGTTIDRGGTANRNSVQVWFPLRVQDPVPTTH